MDGVSEGSTWLPAPAGEHRGPKAREASAPFYNPAMRSNRDLSVLLVAAYAAGRGRPVDVADVLAGTGARSLRLAKEVGLDLGLPISLHGNDGDPKAAAAMREGAERNGVALSIRHGDAHSFLASRRFDVVDIDPYGSPTPFLDAAVRATRHDGLLCVTATDTAALAGRFARVCRRRYGAQHGLHAFPWRSEVGLRILAAAAMQAAGRFDRTATPVLSVFGGHWMRVVLRIEDGRGKADAVLRKLAWAIPAGLGATFATRPPGGPAAGPLWSGPLHDRRLVAAMQAIDAPVHAHTRRLLQHMADEADAPAFWYTLGDLRRHFGRDGPSRDRLLARLRDAGHKASRTHLDPEGVRTDAPEPVLADCWGT